MKTVIEIMSIFGGIAACIVLTDYLVILIKSKRNSTIRKLTGKWLYRGEAIVDGQQQLVFGKCEVKVDKTGFIPRGRFGEIRLKVDGERLRTVSGDEPCRKCKISFPFVENELPKIINNCDVKKCKESEQECCETIGQHWHSDSSYLDKNNFCFSYRFILPKAKGVKKGLCDIYLNETEPLSATGSLLSLPPHKTPADIKFIKV